MNYHIMIDDKFIDGFIEDAELICESNSNIYFIRGNKNDAQYVKHPLAQWVDIWSDDFKKILKYITEEDRIFVHWYDLDMNKIILSINKNVPLYVPFWGGEFFEEPYLYHIDWLHDSKTLQFVKKRNVYPNKWARRPRLLLRQLKSALNYKNSTLADFEIKRRAIQRIDFLLLPKDMAEVEQIKKIYKIDQLSTLPFNYNLNFDFANSIRKQNINKNINILIGNSGTETNNHADCFEILKRYKKDRILLYVPLSYGSKDYISFVKDLGVKLFAENFEPMENFVSRQEYIKKLNNVDIGIMFQNRSQAFGNMITLLSLGKKLYLKKNNPIWQLFKKTGIKVFDANKIKDESFKEFSMPLTPSEVNGNIEKIAELFSDKKRLEDLKKILN